MVTNGFEVPGETVVEGAEIKNPLVTNSVADAGAAITRTVTAAEGSTGC
jgi:hypothetical protein